MSTASVVNVLRVPGRLCMDPTDLTTAFPHGGTALGMVRDAVFKPQFKCPIIIGEEFGNIAVDAMYAGSGAIFAAVCRDMDPDLLAKLWPNVATGAVSGTPYVTQVESGSSSTRAGYLMSAKTFKLLYSPLGTEDHPALLIHKAIPFVDENAGIPFALNAEMEIACGFVGIPNANGRTYAFGKLRDLTTVLT